MNRFQPPGFLCAAILGFCLILAAPSSRVLGQTFGGAGGPAPRWLFVFSTASDMKDYVPATEKEIRIMLSYSVNGEMHAGDSFGAWALNQDLHTGEFPLTVWDPKTAAGTTSNLVKFVREQHYSGKTRFAALRAALDRVVESSDELTVFIFCDGEEDFHFTPYADDINRLFHESLAERKKAKQPYVLVLRTKLGRFAGITVNFPPGALNLPLFPQPAPPPAPVPVVPPPVPVPVAAPATPPPLIMVGTNTGTNLEELQKIYVPPAAPAPPPAPAPAPTPVPVPQNNNAANTNPLPPEAAAQITNTTASSAQTDSVAAANIPNEQTMAEATTSAPSSEQIVAKQTPAVTTTNITAAASQGGNSHGPFLYVVAGFLSAVAVLLIVWFIAKQRRPSRPSLITSSMQQKR